MGVFEYESASPAADLPLTDGVDRRGFLKCMAWAGTATLWTISGGVLTSCGIGAPATTASRTRDLYFVQISDSHIGFKGAANPDITGTFAHAIAQVNALPHRPAFVAHTGDLTHLSQTNEFDTVKQMLGTLKTPEVHTVPGEHDAVGDNANQKYLQVFGKGSRGNGYYSFDLNGVHLLFLVNTSGVENLGVLGRDQLDFIKKDLAGVSSDTPLVVFSHIPLFAMYPKWGWYTHDLDRGIEQHEALLVRDMPQRTRPPADEQGRGQHHVSRGDLHRLSASPPRCPWRRQAATSRPTGAGTLPGSRDPRGHLRDASGNARRKGCPPRLTDEDAVGKMQEKGPTNLFPYRSDAPCQSQVTFPQAGIACRGEPGYSVAVGDRRLWGWLDATVGAHDCRRRPGA